jgi:hypothetical protein
VIRQAAEEAGRSPDAVGLTLTSTSDAKTAFETAETCARLGAERVVVLPPKGALEIDSAGRPSGRLFDELHRFKETVIDPFSA